MSDTTGDAKSWTDHVLNGRAWLRFLFMLLFTPLLGCVGFMVLCVALFQFFSVLANGEDNPQLRALGADLNRLGVDIVAFLTWNTECKPFPFRSCAPGKAELEADTQADSTGDGGSETRTRRARSDSAAQVTSGRKTPTRKKMTARKTGTRKKSTTRKRAGQSRSSRRSRSTSDSKSDRASSGASRPRSGQTGTGNTDTSSDDESG